MNDLLIKGVGDTDYKNGYDYYHVRMGSGFIDAIEGSVQLKEAVENESRLEHGVRMMVNTKKAKRNVTLMFNIHGRTQAEYMTNKAAFETMIQKGLVSIKINDDLHPNYYHLVYTGKSVTYKHSYSGIFGTMACQFTEPNPNNHTSIANEKVRIMT